MLKCTYIVLLDNNENNIPGLISSLKEVKGHFRKEFIIIDDGSQDNSLNVAKSATHALPGAAIITQAAQGGAASINQALNLATGNYVHFVEGDEILCPQSSLVMIEASVKFAADVICSSLGKIAEEQKPVWVEHDLLSNQKLIQAPIIEILRNYLPAVRNIGGSGSMVSRALLEKVGKADNTIYSQTMSLSLRCARYSNFVFIEDVLSCKQSKNLPTKDYRFETYNNLRAIYNFASNHPDICQNLGSDLLRALSAEVPQISAKFTYYLQSVWARRVKSIQLEDILALYKTEYEKLF